MEPSNVEDDEEDYVMEQDIEEDEAEEATNVYEELDPVINYLHFMVYTFVNCLSFTLLVASHLYLSCLCLKAEDGEISLQSDSCILLSLLILFNHVSTIKKLMIQQLLLTSRGS